MNIEIDAPFEEAAELFDEIAQKVFPQAEASAQNDAAAQSKTRIGRKVKERTGVPTKVLNRRMKLHRRRRGRNGSKTARIFIGTVPVAAAPHLNARELKRGGVSYQGPGGRKQDKQAFIADTKRGPRALKRKGSSRYPLQHLTVPIAAPAKQAAREVMSDFYPGAFNRIFASKFSYRFAQAAQKKRRIRLL